MSNILSERARIAALSRSRQPNDPELVEARRNLRGLRLQEVVTQVVNGWPKLTDEQLNRVAAILHAGAQNGAA